jgi:hypothetical protein
LGEQTEAEASKYAGYLRAKKFVVILKRQAQQTANSVMDYQFIDQARIPERAQNAHEYLSSAPAAPRLGGYAPPRTRSARRMLNHCPNGCGRCSFRRPQLDSLSVQGIRL